MNGFDFILICLEWRETENQQLVNLPSDRKAVWKIFASVRLVLTYVDKALHGLTSDFHVLVLK